MEETIDTNNWSEIFKYRNEPGEKYSYMHSAHEANEDVYWEWK